MTEINRYNEWLNSKADAWEAKCTRCGACCGDWEDH